MIEKPAQVAEKPIQVATKEIESPVANQQQSAQVAEKHSDLNVDAKKKNAQVAKSINDLKNSDEVKVDKVVVKNSNTSSEQESKNNNQQENGEVLKKNIPKPIIVNNKLKASPRGKAEPSLVDKTETVEKNQKVAVSTPEIKVDTKKVAENIMNMKHSSISKMSSLLDLNEQNIGAFKMMPTQNMNMAENTSVSTSIQTMQEIMSKIQSMVASSSFNKNSKLSMDFNTKTLGQIQMTLQQKADGITVSMEVGSDSSKQELLNQENDLAKQLKELGYKNVKLDVSYNEKHSQEKSFNEQSGNEVEDNVKLAGNDKLDLDAILSM